MLPTICWLCHVPAKLVSGLCETCFEDLPRMQPEPFEPRVVTRGQSAVRYWAAPLYYTGAVIRWVQQYKFSGQTGLAAHMAPLIVAHMIALYRQHHIYLPEALIAVPLSTTRWLNRGFNQAELIANHIAVLLGIPLLNAVKRQRSTRHSYLMGERERSENLLHAFVCDKPELLAGYKRVAIVDDLVTTGTTANELAGVLKQARVVVDVWALGFTPAPGQEEDNA